MKTQGSELSPVFASLKMGKRNVPALVSRCGLPWIRLPPFSGSLSHERECKAFFVVFTSHRRHVSFVKRLFQFQNALNTFFLLPF